ncbi:MAG: DUF1700 domain-containing protein [Clostridia bacterium]|nr:DUF1700 domain-containing protein [Clostridia bacterium]
MTKQEFLTALQQKLSGLPTAEIEERLAFYGEMIDDRMEDGLSEKDAVAGIGSVREIAEQIITEIPFAKIAKERIKPKRRIKAWEIVLLALGSPIWLSLGIGAFVIFLSLYVVLWSAVVSLWAVFASLAACSLGGVVASVIFLSIGNISSGLALLGAGFVCAGLAIFLFFGCHATTKGILLLTKKIALGIKKCFVKKEAAE